MQKKKAVVAVEQEKIKVQNVKAMVDAQSVSDQIDESVSGEAFSKMIEGALLQLQQKVLVSGGREEDDEEVKEVKLTAEERRKKASEEKKNIANLSRLLSAACEIGDIAGFETLVQKGAQIERVINKKDNPLCVCLRMKNKQLAMHILEKFGQKALPTHKYAVEWLRDAAVYMNDKEVLEKLFVLKPEIFDAPDLIELFFQKYQFYAKSESLGFLIDKKSHYKKVWNHYWERLSQSNVSERLPYQAAQLLKNALEKNDEVLAKKMLNFELQVLEHISGVEKKSLSVELFKKVLEDWLKDLRGEQWLWLLKQEPEWMLKMEKEKSFIGHGSSQWSRTAELELWPSEVLGVYTSQGVKNANEYKKQGKCKLYERTMLMNSTFEEWTKSHPEVKKVGLISSLIITGNYEAASILIEHVPMLRENFLEEHHKYRKDPSNYSWVNACQGVLSSSMLSKVLHKYIDFEDIPLENGENLMHLALRMRDHQRNKGAVEQYVKRYPNALKQVNGYGHTPLMVAQEKMQSEVNDYYLKGLKKLCQELERREISLNTSKSKVRANKEKKSMRL